MLCAGQNRSTEQIFAYCLEISILKFKFDKKKSAFSNHFRPFPSYEKIHNCFEPINSRGVPLVVRPFFCVCLPLGEPSKKIPS